MSVSHRSTVEQHHDKELHLLGDGEWRLGATDDKTTTREPAAT